MKYRIVTSTDVGFITHKPTDVEAWATMMGMTVMGYNANKRQRAELQGQPIISGLCGPMWDGDAVRYEDQATNDLMSN